MVFYFGIVLLLLAPLHSYITAQSPSPSSTSVIESSTGPDLVGGARYGLASTSVGNLVIFAGGSINGAPSNAVDIFDSSTNTWKLGSTLQGGPRAYLAAATVGSFAIFAGGLSNGVSASVDIYDSNSDQWSLQYLPSGGRYGLAATSIGTKAIFAGGVDHTNTEVAWVDIYDSVTSNWTVGPPLAAGPRYYLSAASTQTKAIFAGGSNSVAVLDSVDIYDAISDSWLIGPPLQGGPRSVMGSASVGGKALFAGGRDVLLASFASVDIYDERFDSWSVGPNLHGGPRYALSAAVVNNNYVIFAGGTFGNEFSNITDIYDLSNDNWSVGPELQISRAYMSASSSTDSIKAIFAGGKNLTGLPAVDIFMVPCVPCTGVAPTATAICLCTGKYFVNGSLDPQSSNLTISTIQVITGNLTLAQTTFSTVIINGALPYSPTVVQGNVDLAGTLVVVLTDHGELPTNFVIIEANGTLQGSFQQIQIQSNSTNLSNCSALKGVTQIQNNQVILQISLQNTCKSNRSRIIVVSIIGGVVGICVLFSGLMMLLIKLRILRRNNRIFYSIDDEAAISRHFNQLL